MCGGKHGKHDTGNSGRGNEGDEAVPGDALERSGEKGDSGQARAAEKGGEYSAEEQAHEKGCKRIQQDDQEESDRKTPKRNETLVLDSNILFSALIKDSQTRRFITEYKGELLVHSFLLEELDKYKDFLISKSRLDGDDFEELVRTLLMNTKRVDFEETEHYLDEAESLVKYIDINDLQFVACCLAYPNSIIWSDDRALKRLRRVRVMTTKELLSHGML